jgi:hypothetical protein
MKRRTECIRFTSPRGKVTIVLMAAILAALSTGCDAQTAATSPPPISAQTSPPTSAPSPASPKGIRSMTVEMTQTDVIKFIDPYGAPRTYLYCQIPPCQIVNRGYLTCECPGTAGALAPR